MAMGIAAFALLNFDEVVRAGRGEGDFVAAFLDVGLVVSFTFLIVRDVIRKLRR